MPDMVGIILAAGKGTRMKSKLPKALHPICGKPISRYVIDACRESGIGDCVVVIGHGADQVRAGLGDDVRYAIQSQQLGTGDACKRAIEVLDGADGDVIVLPGDAPMIGADILKKLSGEHAASGAAATVLTAVLDDARQYGRVIRGADRNVERIVEAKDASPEELKVGEINAAVYCFNLALLRKYLGEITPANAQGEYYLTDVIGLMVRDGLTVGAVVSDDPNVVLGINDRVDLAHLAGLIRRNILEKLMVGGVTVVDPSSTYVDADVVVGADTVIHPQTYIEKGCKIGEGCCYWAIIPFSQRRVGERDNSPFFQSYRQHIWRRHSRGSVCKYTTRLPHRAQSQTWRFRRGEELGAGRWCLHGPSLLHRRCHNR